MNYVADTVYENLTSMYMHTHTYNKLFDIPNFGHTYIRIQSCLVLTYRFVKDT